MALFRDLVRTIAEAEGLSEMTVTGVGQYLRDAGLISKHGRGKAAAQMTVSDAVNLLIGVNASALAKDAPDTVRKILEIEDRQDIYQIDRELSCESELTKSLYEPKNVSDLLNGLLSCFILADGSVKGYDVSLTFSRPTLGVDIWVGWISENPDEEQDEPLAVIAFNGPKTDRGDRSDKTTITEKTLSAVGALLRT